MAVMVVGLWNYETLPTTYYQALKAPPGLWFVYALCALVVVVMLWRLPRVWLTILRKPAVEFDGRTLTVRNFSTRRFEVSTTDIRYSISREGGPIIIRAGGAEVARFHPSRIDGALTLTRLLDHLGQTAPESA